MSDANNSGNSNGGQGGDSASGSQQTGNNGNNQSANQNAGSPPNPPAAASGSPKTFSESEVTARVLQAKEEARSEEKDKLYGQIDGLKARNKSSEEEIKTLKDQLDTLQKASSKDGKLDVKALIAEAVSKTRADEEEKWQKTVADLTKQVQDLTTETRQAKLDGLREKLIQEAGGPNRTIVGMIRGKTEAELRESAAEAKRTFDDIIANNGKGQSQATGGDEGNSSTQDPPPPVPGANPGQTNSGQGGMPDVRSMSMEEFKKHSAELKRQAQNVQSQAWSTRNDRF